MPTSRWPGSKRGGTCEAPERHNRVRPRKGERRKLLYMCGNAWAWQDGLSCCSEYATKRLTTSLNGIIHQASVDYGIPRTTEIV